MQWKGEKSRSISTTLQCLAASGRSKQTEDISLEAEEAMWERSCLAQFWDFHCGSFPQYYQQSSPGEKAQCYMTEEHGVPDAWLVTPEALAPMGPSGALFHQEILHLSSASVPLSSSPSPATPTRKRERLSGLNLPSKISTGNKIK